MNAKIFGLIAVGAAAAVSGFGAESMADHGNGSESTKPMGFRFFNNHLTIKPYVSLSYTYDSNVDTTRHASGDGIFCVEPGADFTWRGDRWELAGRLYYSYNAYCKYSDELGAHGYGEMLNYKWSNVSEEGKGWTLLLSQQYRLINQSDSLESSEGRGLWRDRQHTALSGVLERRFTDLWHADLQGQYTWLDYKNDTGSYAPLYGWSQYAVGLEAGYVASKYTDILIAGGYSHYNQSQSGRGEHRYSNNSQVWSAQAGLGTHATDQISYRALMGISQLDYGGRDNTDCGWTYQLSANWRPFRELQFSVLGNSYYQPSERSLGQAVKVYALSGGVSYLTMGDKMTLTANIAWRHEQNVYSDSILAAGNDYDEDLLSVRLGANYTLNRWMSIYANFVWDENWCGSYDYYNYDRFRGTLGVRFHY